jgi:hypothetical protein
MAINTALRKFGKSPRARRAPRSEPLAIGEVDASVFNCPNCARPLANGANFCPGCGTRLIVGVRARLALGFLAVGLVAGVMLGSGAMVVVGGRQATVAATTDGTAVVPGTNTGTATGPSAVPLLPADVGIPSQAVSSLRQAAIVNARLSGYADELDRALASKATKGIDIARILRGVSADVLFGVAIAPSIAPWPDAAGLSSDLSSFYVAVRDSAQKSLKPSVSDTSAYKAAGKRMAKLLSKLDALDARAAELVTAAGLAPLAP